MIGRDLLRAVWRKSSHSSGGSTADCIEVAALGRGTIAARDSKNPDGPVLGFSLHEWSSFVSSIKTGDLGNPG
jgi:hypothetical protein